MTWAPDYASVAELRAYLNIRDDVDDVQLDSAISAASRSVDQMTGRQFGLVDTPEPRWFRAERDVCGGRWTISIDDLMTAPTAVATDPDGDESWAGDLAGAYTLLDRNAPAEGRPWERLTLSSAAAYYPTGTDRLVQVTAAWGWSAVPATVEQATLLQAARIFKRRVAPFGVAGPTSDAAPALRLLAKIDPDVQVMLRPYVRRWSFR